MKLLRATKLSTFSINLTKIKTILLVSKNLKSGSNKAESSSALIFLLIKSSERSWIRPPLEKSLVKPLKNSNFQSSNIILTSRSCSANTIKVKTLRLNSTNSLNCLKKSINHLTMKKYSLPLKSSTVTAMKKLTSRSFMQPSMLLKMYVFFIYNSKPVAQKLTKVTS